MKVYVRNRNHEDFSLPGGLGKDALRPIRYRTEAQGGPLWAEIWVDGDANTLWQLLSWLRYDVRIQNRYGEAVWWGYINNVRLEAGGISIGVDLDSMANKVATLWSGENTGGMTAWAEDANSIANYGTKELLLSLADVDEAAALQRRDWELERRKYPTPVVELSTDQRNSFAILQCRGWFDSTEWTYYDRDEGLEEYSPSGGVGQKVGWGFSSAELAFTSRGRRLSELHNKLNELDKGDKIAITGTTSNNTTLTIESSSTAERTTVTATSIAFLHEVRNAAGEYIRARHSVARKLNNYNLFALENTSISTLSVTANATDTTLTLNSVGNLQSGDRIRIGLNAGGYHTTFISGTPDSGANTISIRDEMPSTANSGNDVDRTNRWVTNEVGDVYYTETTDYTVDAAGGKITVVSTGAIAQNQILRVSYRYIEYRIEDSALGLTFVGANDVIRVTGSSSNNGYFRVLSGTTDGDRITVKETVTVEDPGASVTIARGSNLVVLENITSELPDGTTSETVTAYGSRVVQSFQISSDVAWTVNKIEVRARKVGSPTDNLRLGIRSDTAGTPGSLLESVDIPADDLSTQLAWTTGNLANTTNLATSTTYWVSVGRSGAQDAENYYEVAVDEDLGYTSGVLKLYDGAAYQDRPTDGDLVFRLLGAEVTTTQIVQLVSQEGQFLAGTSIIDASGISTNQYRNGHTFTRDELLDLLEIGTTNSRRLLSSITPERYLVVKEEPAKPSIADYQLTSDRGIRTKLGASVRQGTMHFVGQWVALVGIPPTANFSTINSPSPFFVESAEYDAEASIYIIEPAGGLPTWRVGMSIDEG